MIVNAFHRCSVGRPTAHASGSRPTGSVTDDDRRQTTDASEQNNTGPLGLPVIIVFMLLDFDRIKKPATP